MTDRPLESRLEYEISELTESTLDENPVRQLERWLHEAAATSLVEPNAMCLATVGRDGRPSGRMVLLRGIDERGLSFFSNYSSRKGEELGANPYGSICFWWPSLERQVRAEGIVELLTALESDAYFASRPRESQLASAASPQSQIIASRTEVEARIAELDALHPTAIPRPAHWGGYRLVPDRFEFWQGRPARLHDRLIYRLVEGRWELSRLAP